MGDISKVGAITLYPAQKNIQKIIHYYRAGSVYFTVANMNIHFFFIFRTKGGTRAGNIGIDFTYNDFAAIQVFLWIS